MHYCNINSDYCNTYLYMITLWQIDIDVMTIRSIVDSPI